MGELSRVSGVPVPTIKFYLREGLLPAGELTSPNQARYGEEHARRLHLIRALTDVGSLPLASVAKVLEAVDDRERPVHKLLGAASGTLTPVYAPDPDPANSERARALVADLIARRGWQVQADSAPAVALTAAASAVLAVGLGDYLDYLDEFAASAEQVAAADLSFVARAEAAEDKVERVVLGTVLGDAMLAALRRLAQVDASARRYPGPAGTPDAGEPTSG
ncbi:MerR family transcriptional regulator [Streptomyces sp. ISL-94]|uniref:MerR family transcriptional regulator n=1 Tax=Streptomyces sp. ISL-94 TaxID=2819190 RepID=UPI001BE7D3BA|nr:MerR family transcriptional regulator [Streptomyces sp. ISL-94]MBT2477684.1 MerR family transcriptional regulator [Streptomyces sp. ISL-94]